jgi:hypothetical protein
MTSVGTRVTSARRIVTLSTGCSTLGGSVPALGPSAWGFLTRYVEPRARRRRRTHTCPRPPPAAARGAGAYDTRVTSSHFSAARSGHRGAGGGISFTFFRTYCDTDPYLVRTSKPHRATSADSGPSVFTANLGFRSVPRDPTAPHRASGRYHARARADTHGGRPDPGARSRACQRNRANGTCATSGPCQAPRHQAPTSLRKLLQRVYMYTKYRPSRQAEPADEGPAHGTQGDGCKLRARKLHA